MSDSARFWAVDLHVHTPGSEDARDDDFGTAVNIVDAAIQAGLDAIAVTDHNTASWCQDVANAAADKPLIVLPGVEISTTEGHLLALWEEGTDSTMIEEVLVKLGIGRAERGKLDISASVGLAEAATEVEASGGLAVAAHVEKDKGLLKLAVKAHLKKTLLEESIRAVEIVHLDTAQEIERRIDGARTMALVRGSDTWDTQRNCHGIVGIGARRTWVKASRADLVGLRHAFADPHLRLRLEAPPTLPPFCYIASVRILGGFLGGQEIKLSPDLNCLLGGTGAGKSLILEAIRFALDQQVDPEAFPAIRQEIDSRMEKAAVNGSVVVLEVVSSQKSYRIERTYYAAGSAPSRVLQQTGDEWIEIGEPPFLLCPIAAFSQGEILEYSREPVGRMALVDASINLEDVGSRIDVAIDSLHANARELIRARSRVGRLEEEAAHEAELSEQVRQLTQLFSTDTVQEQSKWTQEQTLLARVQAKIDSARPSRQELPEEHIKESVPANGELFESVSSALADLKARIDLAMQEIDSALTMTSTRVGEAHATWRDRFNTFKLQLDEELNKIDSGASLASLRANLEQLQLRLTQAQESKRELEQEAQPELTTLEADRERLIGVLHGARRERRDLRRARVAKLNSKTAGFVKLDVPDYGDETEFRHALDQIKVGSRVRDDFLNRLAKRVSPLQFVRSMISENLNGIVDTSSGIDMASVAKLLANVHDRDLWEQLLAIQTIDRPDVLTIKFRKPKDQTYTAIEELAHGQRCTAILVILLADGETPVLVDQPEDALHAPWIEEYLVDRLRALRGTRQYLFATRSPGIVVSGDAEQIITMKATAGHGEVEASGSLERHELNKLALNHLEGGRIPFRRRTSKLRSSVDDPD